MTRTFRCFITWKTPQTGSFEVINGTLDSLRLAGGEGRIVQAELSDTGRDPITVEAQISGSDFSSGEGTTIVRWRSAKNSFSFLPVHLFEDGVVSIPDFEVTISTTIADQALPTIQDDSYPDAAPTGSAISWETWASLNNAPQPVPTVLGLSRDQRFFVIEPDKERFSATLDFKHTQIIYITNRASTAADRCERSLEDGHLPILHSKQQIGPFLMEDTWFVTLGDKPLTEANIQGTPLDISHLRSVGSTFPPDLREAVERKAKDWKADGEVVAYLRTRITNLSQTPRLAVHKLPTACMLTNGKEPVRFDGPWHLQEDGTVFADKAPLSLHRVNGAPPHTMQPAVLLRAGETLTLDAVLSHSLEGLSPEVRAAGIPWDQKLAEAKAFWQRKIEKTARISLPETRLENFWKAGLCHIELSTLGQKQESLLAKVGMYSAIGSESIPIIEFFDSLGMHDVAERTIDAFFDYQWSNGRLNLFLHYDIETGGILFTSGRHFAYTQNKDWVVRRKEQFQQAADYLLSLRQKESSDSPGYGLISGACADPKDKQSAFMLNAYAIAGIQAVAEMLHAIQDDRAALYQQQAAEFRSIFLTSFRKSFELGPVLPISPTQWVPTCAPWAEGIGLQMMGLQGEICYSHRSYAVYDAILGPLYAVFAGIVDPDDRHTRWLLEINAAQMNRSSISESQPYYGRHPEIHLLRGEREAFLNAFYSGLVSMADRETFSFWEHFYQVSIHKTHEEGWALMQLRRMLWVELKDTLHLLWGIPETWVGKPIRIEQGASYFGSVSFHLEPLGEEWIFRWKPAFHTSPHRLILHLAGHPFQPTSNAHSRVDEEGNIEILNPSEPIEIRLKPITRG